MRLIDADELIKGRVENDPVVIAGKCAPIAYDVDKVVEQLEKSKSGLTAWAEDEAYKLGIEKAIEVVKAESEGKNEQGRIIENRSAHSV